MGSRVVIVGAGAIGASLATLLEVDGAAVKTVDLVARTPNTIVGDILAPPVGVVEALYEADVVVLAVDEDIVLRALPTVTETVRSDALIVETLSVKSRISDALRTHLPQHQSLGINPLFAPSLGYRGRRVAAVVHRDGAAVEQFLDQVSSWGATVLHQTADRHDRIAAATQALTHATVLAFGLGLESLDVTAQELADFGPPPHQMLLALLARVSGGDAHVYHDIQAANPYAAYARGQLMSGAFVVETTATRSAEDFGRAMTQAQAALGDLADTYRATCAEIFEAFTGSK